MNNKEEYSKLLKIATIKGKGLTIEQHNRYMVLRKKLFGGSI